MAGNTIGTLFRITTFGESHGAAIGGIIDGCPSGIDIDVNAIQKELDRRRPGQSTITTQRKECDRVEILSGVFEGKTLGTPIGFVIRNKDAKSSDYDELKSVYRPSHADNTYDAKYGHRDHRGGGRSSARETACRVVGGSIARQVLTKVGVNVWAYVSAVGPVETNQSYLELDSKKVEDNLVRCPDAKAAEQMIALITQLKERGDSVGGIVSCVVTGCPLGLGEPVFDKLNADLGKAVLGINAVKGFEIGSGFAGSKMMGSEHNDRIKSDFSTESNRSGGVQGGISNGEDIFLRVAFKPTATILKDQKTVDDSGNEVVLKAKGRHDPCVVPRAVPIVEAMVLLTIVDHYLRNQSVKLSE